MEYVAYLQWRQERGIEGPDTSFASPWYCGFELEWLDILILCIASGMEAGYDETWTCCIYMAKGGL